MQIVFRIIVRPKMKFIKPSFMTILVLIPIFFATHECRIISSHDADETVVQEVNQ